MSLAAPKVCIVAPSSLSYVPYLDIYTDLLEKLAVPYDIVYWDRFVLHENRKFSTAYIKKGTVRGFSLLPAYMGFRRFLMSYFGVNSYDKYIILSSQVSVLLFDFLKDKRFILDIRDYSHERFFLYRLMLSKIIKCAEMCNISSGGFTQWLPKGVDYVVSHNARESLMAKISPPFKKNEFIISYIGAVGYFNANVKFLEAISAQGRYSIYYRGKGTEDQRIKDYVLKNKINNVFFTGGFSPQEKDGFYHNTNFVLCCYGDDSMVVKSLLPNRLYESCVFHRPIIVNKGTYLADVVSKYEIGIVCDLDDLTELEEKMDMYYNDDYFCRYINRCELFVGKIKADMQVFEEIFASVIFN